VWSWTLESRVALGQILGNSSVDQRVPAIAGLLVLLCRLRSREVLCMTMCPRNRRKTAPDPSPFRLVRVIVLGA